MNKAFGAPERVIEVCAVTLELGSKAAVNNSVAAGLAEKVGHESRPKEGGDSHVEQWKKDRMAEKTREVS